MAPRDPDISFNLSLARSHIRDEENSLVKRLLLYFTGGELAWFLAFWVWVFFLLLGAVILSDSLAGTTTVEKSEV